MSVDVSWHRAAAAGPTAPRRWPEGGRGFDGGVMPNARRMNRHSEASGSARWRDGPAAPARFRDDAGLPGQPLPPKKSLSTGTRRKSPRSQRFVDACRSSGSQRALRRHHSLPSEMFCLNFRPARKGSINGHTHPWALGPEPSTYIWENPKLERNATWSGVLVGFTPINESVVGDASLMFGLSTFEGDLDFTGMWKWPVRQGAMDGSIWGDGDLHYAVHIYHNGTECHLGDNIADRFFAQIANLKHGLTIAALGHAPDDGRSRCFPAAFANQHHNTSH